MPKTHQTPLMIAGILAAFPFISFDILQPALPEITHYFNTSPAIGQLCLSLFFIAFGFSQLIWGAVIDKYGRRKPFVISILMFCFSTSLCIMAGNIIWLLLGRVLQGISVCCAHNIAFSSTHDISDPRERAKRISHLAIIVSISMILSPIVGSTLFTMFGWNSLFILLLCLGAMVCTVSLRYIHENQDKKHDSLANPLQQYMRLLQEIKIVRVLFLNALAFSNIMIFIVNASYIFMSKLGYSPEQYSLLFSLLGFMLILSNLTGIFLRERYSLCFNIRLGTIIMLCASMLLFLLSTYWEANVWCYFPILFIAFGAGLTNPPAVSLAMQDYGHVAGSVTAVINTSRAVLSAGIAGLVSLIIGANIHILPIVLVLCSGTCFMLVVRFYPLKSVR